MVHRKKDFIMGQRLCLEIYRKMDDEQPFALIYYHWSAYTECLFQEVADLVKGIPESTESLSDKELAQVLISFVEERGGGVSKEDHNYLFETYGIKNLAQDMSRNDGILSFSEEEMGEFYSWGEGFSSICLKEGVFSDGLSIEIDCIPSEYAGTIPTLPQNEGWFNLSDVEELSKLVLNTEYYKVGNSYFECF